MAAILPALLLSLRQLFEGRVLRILLKSAGVSLLAFALVATAGWNLLDWALERFGFGDTLFAGSGAMRGALAALATFVGLWLTWRLVAMAVVQFFADEVVEAVEAQHYPDAAQHVRQLSLGQEARGALRGTGRALLANLIAAPFAIALLVTGVGTFVLFLLVNAWLLGRELQDMVWLRLDHAEREAAPLGKGARFLLGGVIAAMLAVPLISFLAPVFGAAAATHAIHRQTARKPFN